ncbi:hypothetical protein FRC17_010719 [Serendipita sp. 399]|nr:hypothetical protein FRC17_010719 [Serendipita sp. 399]
MVRQTDDLSEPISVLLRKGTQQAHESAEHSQGAGWLTRGELDKEEYIRFLFMLWNVYSALEQGLSDAHDNSILKPTYKPTVLARAENISLDIAFLLGTSEWQSHPFYKQYLTSIPQPVTTYTERLHSLSSSPTTSGLLLAHAYVRYLGDLSGGQFIRRRIAKVYNLPSNGDGVRFYLFSNGNGEEAGPSEVRELKEWYRDGMNVGVGDDEELKESLIDEAILAFKLNQDLFTVLKPPTTLPNNGEQEKKIITAPYTEPPTPNTLVPPGLVSNTTISPRRKGLSSFFARSREFVILSSILTVGLLFAANKWIQ